MKFTVTIDGQPQTVELERQRQAWECSIDGRPRQLDVVEIAPGQFSLLLDGESFEVHVEGVGGGSPGGPYRVHTGGHGWVVEVAIPGRGRARRSGLGRSGRQEITAPMPGKVVCVLVEEKQAVEEGQGLIVVEAMKMQNQISAPQKGVVERLLVEEGATVNHGDLLVVVES
jgi:biotin carboxyl carrier protein